MPETLESLHMEVLRWIHAQGWTELHPIQHEALQSIVPEGPDHLLMASTAGGKTEAAFFPILSDLLRGPEALRKPAGFQVLYLSPLKALINDQADRLARMTKEMGVPVTPWHGDVATSKKRRVENEPNGILVITPESLEAMLCRRGDSFAAKLFGRLRFVVIDELHAFMGTERGKQLQSLCTRIENLRGQRVPRIALSATIGEPGEAAEFLRPSHGNAVRILKDDRQGAGVNLQVRGYRVPRVNLDAADDDNEQSAQSRIADHLFGCTAEGNHIIFANRRADVEEFADRLQRLCAAKNVPGRYFPHHGSLSKELRHEAEKRLKDNSLPTTLVATVTLELGIDVGHIDGIGQIGAPSSVSSIRQRLGRSGRRGSPAVLRVYLKAPDTTPDSPPQDTLRPEIIQTVAIVNLLVKRAYDDPATGALHLSTLTQQLLSLVAQKSGITPKRALDTLSPVFSIEETLFMDVCQQLTQRQVLDSIDGTLVLGVKGERIVDHFEFYAAFQTPDEYVLLHSGRQLGTLPIVNPLFNGALIIFGGRRWIVDSVDTERRRVELKPSKTGRAPAFSGSGAEVHDLVRREMRFVYEQEQAIAPQYLDSVAAELFAEGRAAYRDLRLHKRQLIPAAGGTLLFPWRGDRIHNTIALMLVQKGVQAATDGLAIEVEDVEPAETSGLLKEIRSSPPPSATELAKQVASKVIEKHDLYYNDDLLGLNYGSRHLDVSGALDAIEEMLAGLGN